ncbi:MAG: hypothetical protein P4L46_08945 [Fimbriimonas sp.]|nr:hypothetical protein [Fimbriimonas sp.]
MRKSRTLLFALGIVVTSVVCGACSNGIPEDKTVARPADASKLANQGQGGVKARMGGGMAPEPMSAAPGEKTGLPK